MAKAMTATATDSQDEVSAEEAARLATTRWGRARAEELFNLLKSEKTGKRVKIRPDRAGAFLVAEFGSRPFKASAAFENESDTCLVEIKVEGVPPEPCYRYHKKDKYEATIEAGASLLLFSGLSQQVYMRALNEARRLERIAELQDLMENVIKIGKRPDLMGWVEKQAIRYNRPVAYQLMTEADAIWFLSIWKRIHENGDKIDPDGVIDNSIEDDAAVEAEA